MREYETATLTFQLFWKQSELFSGNIRYVGLEIVKHLLLWNYQNLKVYLIFLGLINIINTASMYYKLGIKIPEHLHYITNYYGYRVTNTNACICTYACPTFLLYLY